MGTTICLINQKGGCGKSSTCFHLAGAFAQQGLRVALIERQQAIDAYKKVGTHYIQADAMPVMRRLGVANLIEESHPRWPLLQRASELERWETATHRALLEATGLGVA